MILLIDNYDSFTYNLVQYLGELDAEPIVYRHDAITVEGIEALEPDAVISHYSELDAAIRALLTRTAAPAAQG